jgi:hypothetical protein
VPLSRTDTLDASSPCPPAVCVGAVLGDALHRVSVLGGRDGMPRSLGSVYGGAVTRFLGVGRVVSRVIDTPGVVSVGSGLAVTCDGSTLLVVDSVGGSHAMHEFTAHGCVSSVGVVTVRSSCSARDSCTSHPTASCSSRTASTTACRC